MRKSERVSVRVCACIHEKEREREREREREIERERNEKISPFETGLCASGFLTEGRLLILMSRGSSTF